MNTTSRRASASRGRSASAIVLVAAAVAAAGCGGAEAPSGPAEPHRYRLAWVDLDGAPGQAFRLEVRSLEIRGRRWAVQASFRNETSATWLVGRPHFQDQTKIGLVVALGDFDPLAEAERTGALTPQLLADVFVPPFPTRLEPGAHWSGSFSGPGRPTAGSRIRVAIGRLTTLDDPPAGLPARLVVVSSHELVLQ